jgi:hypothetical protein
MRLLQSNTTNPGKKKQREKVRERMKLYFEVIKLK